MPVLTTSAKRHGAFTHRRTFVPKRNPILPEVEMRKRSITLSFTGMLLVGLPGFAEARACPCVAYQAAKRIYKPRVVVRYVINPIYPFYPYLRSSWRLYYGYPRYEVVRTYRTVRRVHVSLPAPVIAEPIDK
jgi:hypothetical protein